MQEGEAVKKLKAAGYPTLDALNMLLEIRRNRMPSLSRKEKNRYPLVEQALREVGIDPSEIEFREV